MVKLVVGLNEVSSTADGYDVTGEVDNTPKHDYLRNKMEEMQKRIDELKEKVRIEETALQDAESTIDINDICQYTDSCSNIDESNIDDNYECSEKSLYFSASNNSICSFRSNSTATTYYNFTKFINNFVQNQSPKERLSLLQLHSKKQISLNMMKHSLEDLDMRCSDELEFVEKSLQHLQRLATEFDVNIESGSGSDNDQSKAVECYSVSDLESDKCDANTHNFTFEWKNSNGFFSHGESDSVIL